MTNNLSPQNRLRTLRRERGLTLEQVSHATGLAFQGLHSAETKHRDITLGTALKLARFYGLPLENMRRIAGFVATAVDWVLINVFAGNEFRE